MTASADTLVAAMHRLMLAGCSSAAASSTSAVTAAGYRISRVQPLPPSAALRRPIGAETPDPRLRVPFSLLTVGR